MNEPELTLCYLTRTSHLFGMMVGRSRCLGFSAVLWR
jgi:hypothetical protein